MFKARRLGLWLIAVLFASFLHVAPVPSGAGGLEVRHAPVAQAVTSSLVALIAKPVLPDGKARLGAGILPADPATPPVVAPGGVVLLPAPMVRPPADWPSLRQARAPPALSLFKTT